VDAYIILVIFIIIQAFRSLYLRPVGLVLYYNRNDNSNTLALGSD